MIAFVREVILRSMSSGSQLKLVSSTSTNTGRAPVLEMHPAVAKKVKLGQITSSPAPMPSAMSATRSASVPEETPMACSTPQ